MKLHLHSCLTPCGMLVIPGSMFTLSDTTNMYVLYFPIPWTYIYCRKIREKGLKHAKDSSLSNDWTSRFLQGLSINQCWCTSSHPDWRSYEGSGDHNTSYFLLSSSTLHTNLCRSIERSFMNLVLLYNKHNFKKKACFMYSQLI